MSKYRNIIFDFGAVLLDLNVEATIDAFKRIGLDDVENFINAAHQQGMFRDAETGSVTPEQFYENVKQYIGRMHPGREVTTQQIYEAWCQIAEGVPAYKLDYIKTLKERGYHIALLSNTNAIHWKYCASMFEAAHFDLNEVCEWVWLSFEMHHVKPEPEIFAQMLQQSGYRPEETLFIDDAERNCRVAETFGIHTFMPKAREDWRLQLEEVIA